MSLTDGSKVKFKYGNDASSYKVLNNIDESALYHIRGDHAGLIANRGLIANSGGVYNFNGTLLPISYSTIQANLSIFQNQDNVPCGYNQGTVFKWEQYNWLMLDIEWPYGANVDVSTILDPGTIINVYINKATFGPPFSLQYIFYNAAGLSDTAADMNRTRIFIRFVESLASPLAAINNPSSWPSIIQSQTCYPIGPITKIPNIAAVSTTGYYKVAPLLSNRLLGPDIDHINKAVPDTLGMSGEFRSLLATWEEGETTDRAADSAPIIIPLIYNSPNAMGGFSILNGSLTNPLSPYNITNMYNNMSNMPKWYVTDSNVNV